MPYSSYKGKKLINDWLKEQKDIKSVVDFGCGAGYYGKEIKAIHPQAHLTAVEVYEPYKKRFKLQETYDQIIWGDIRGVKWPDADLAIFGDVLEHFEKPDALLIITTAILRYKHIIVSIPIGEYPQGAVGGNEFETHKSTWEFVELYELLKDFTIKAEFPVIGVFIK